MTVTDLAERERTERALRQSEERFAKAFQASPIPISITRLGDGTFLDVNDAFLRALGFRRDEVIGRTSLELGLYADPRRRGAVVETLRRERSVRNCEFSVRTKAGEIREMVVNIELFDLEGEVCVLSTSYDITERRRAEEAAGLRAQRARLMADLSRAFVEVGLDYQGVLRTVAERTAETIGDACVMTRFTDDGQRSLPVAFHHRRADALRLMGETLGSWGGSTDTPTFRALLAGETIWIPVTTSSDARSLVTAEFHPYLEEVGISSTLIVSLQVQGRVIGTLGIARDRGGQPYAAEDKHLMRELADRAALTIENARLFEALTEQREELRRLSARLVETQEAERRAIARELHDEVGQLLTSLRFLAEAGERAGVPIAREQVAETTSRVLERIKDLSLNLRPPMLDDLGLVPTLLWHFERYGAQTGVGVRFRHRGAGGRLAPEAEIAMFRIVQEALTNVARHAATKDVRVDLENGGGKLVVGVEDEGQGFEPRALQASSGGLTGMRERARLLGGSFEIDSEPGRGTRLRAWLPVGTER